MTCSSFAGNLNVASGDQAVVSGGMFDLETVNRAWYCIRDVRGAIYQIVCGRRNLTMVQLWLSLSNLEGFHLMKDRLLKLWFSHS